MSASPRHGGLAGAGMALRLQAILRRINDEIAAQAADGSTVAFVCECDDRACVEAIELQPELYRQLRLVPTRFAVRSDHVDARTERLVTDGGTYAIVERARLDESAEPTLRGAGSAG
jgi:hypothetical protein